MRIIFGTDFTDNAAAAGNVAAALAERLGDTVVVVHALDAGGLSRLSPQALASISRDTRADLEREAERLRRLGPAVKTDLLLGAPDETIARKAAVAGARWVMVSSLGKRAPERWLLGSVSERVAETSPVPTWVMRQDEPLLSWARRRQTLRVLCAYDFTLAADAALSQVKALRRIGPCDIVVAQVDWPLSEKIRLGIPGPVPLEANQPEVQTILQRELSERVQAVLGKTAAEVRVRVEAGLGRPDFRLIDIAKAERADLIVTGTHQWRGFERLWHVSTSRGLLHYAPMSVLVVPAAPEPLTQGIPEIRRVLAATDFSALGNHAVPHAYAALPAGGSVKLIHVVAPRRGAGRPAPPYEGERRTKKTRSQAASESLQKLRRLIPPEAEARGIVTEVELIEGRDAARAIVQAAERFGAHLICLGSHGRTGVSKALLGSVAHQVMAQTRRPVFIVREVIR